MVSFKNIKVKILDTKVYNKNNKFYYIIKLFINFSDNVYNVFVTKDIYDEIMINNIDDDNILDYLLIYVDSKGVITFSIKK